MATKFRVAMVAAILAVGYAAVVLGDHDSVACQSIRFGSKYEGVRFLDQHRTIGHMYATCEEAQRSTR